MDEAKVPNYRYLLTEAFKRNRPHEVRALIERDSAWVRVALYDIWDSERESRHSRDRCAGCGPIGCVSFLHFGTEGWTKPRNVVAAKRTKLIYSHPFHPSVEQRSTAASISTGGDGRGMAAGDGLAHLSHLTVRVPDFLLKFELVH